MRASSDDPTSGQADQFLLFRFLNEKVSPFKMWGWEGLFQPLAPLRSHITYGKRDVIPINCVSYRGPSEYGISSPDKTIPAGKLLSDMYEWIDKAGKSLVLSGEEKIKIDKGGRRAVFIKILEECFSKVASELKEDQTTIDLFRQALNNESNYNDIDLFGPPRCLLTDYYLNNQELLSRITRMAKTYYKTAAPDETLDKLNRATEQFGIIWSKCGDQYRFGFATQSEDKDFKGTQLRAKVDQFFKAYGIDLAKVNTFDAKGNMCKGRSVPCDVIKNMILRLTIEDHIKMDRLNELGKLFNEMKDPQFEKNSKGYLEYAVENEKWDAVRFLLEHNATPIDRVKRDDKEVAPSELGKKEPKWKRYCDLLEEVRLEESGRDRYNVTRRGL